jgi:hypothetical protein
MGCFEAEPRRQQSAMVVLETLPASEMFTKRWRHATPSAAECRTRSPREAALYSAAQHQKLYNFPSVYTKLHTMSTLLTVVTSGEAQGTEKLDPEVACSKDGCGSLHVTIYGWGSSPASRHGNHASQPCSKGWERNSLAETKRLTGIRFETSRYRDLLRTPSGERYC